MKYPLIVGCVLGAAVGVAATAAAATIPVQVKGPSSQPPTPVIVECESPSPSPSPTVTVTVDEEGNIVDELQPELPDAGSQDLGGVPEGEEPSPSPSPTLTPIPTAEETLDGDQGVSPSESAGNTAEIDETEGHSGGSAGEPEAGSASAGPGLTPEETIEETTDGIDSGEPDADAG